MGNYFVYTICAYVRRSSEGYRYIYIYIYVYTREEGELGARFIWLINQSMGYCYVRLTGGIGWTTVRHRNRRSVNRSSTSSVGRFSDLSCKPYPWKRSAVSWRWKGKLMQTIPRTSTFHFHFILFFYFPPSIFRWEFNSVHRANIAMHASINVRARARV